MFWRILLASLAVLAVSFPGHLVFDRLWALVFGPILDALFRNRRRIASLRAMWLDFINMCATDLLSLLCGLLILGRGSSHRSGWILVGVVAATSAAMVVIVSTRSAPRTRADESRAPATPMMIAGSLVAVLMGIILLLARR